MMSKEELEDRTDWKMQNRGPRYLLFFYIYIAKIIPEMYNILINLISYKT